MLPRGTRIYCPKCGRHLATSRVEIIRKSQLFVTDSFNYHGFTPNGPMVCPDDGTAYSVTEKGKTKIYTKGGWR